MKTHCTAVLLLCLLCAAYISADPPGTEPDPYWRPRLFSGATCPRLGCCPNDYVHKPFPAIVPISHCGGVNDYDRKPLPHAPPLFRCGGPNDYCRKPLPYLLCPPFSPFLQCGPSIGSCPASDNRR